MNTFLQRIGLLAVFFAGGAVLLAGCMQAPERTPATLAGVTPHVQAGSPADAGRYLVYVGGCNDCHTPGFNESGGSTPEADWLTGSPVGFRGPWGTTYPSNLRLLVQDMNEDAWVTMLRTRKDLPPMPWPNMNRLSEQDARAIHRFISSLGPKGDRMPVAVGPDREPATPYVSFEPLHMDRLGSATAQVSSLNRP